MDNKLEKLREEIDKLDDEFLNLLSKRISIVRKIGEIKKLSSAELFDEKRKMDVLQKWKKKAKKEKLSPKMAEEIYKLVHDYSLKIERLQNE